jgi:hypothetical protein
MTHRLTACPSDLAFQNIHSFILNIFIQAQIFWWVRGPRGVAFGTAPKSFCTPANYIYLDLIYPPPQKKFISGWLALEYQ